ncbi:MAG: NAD(P)H-dependent flavin oxidoreductase, partial [Longicatena caecimuris]
DLITNKAEPLEKILADVKALLPEFEERYQRQVPIFVAGGIYDAQDIRHFCDLGAAGVQMGTRFIATQECDASPAFKEVIVQAQKEDIELVKSPAGLPGRAVMTDFMRQVKEKRIAPSHCIGCMLPCKPATTPYCISEALIHAVHGEVEQGLVFAGANAWRITEIVTVKQLMDELKAAFI